MTKDRVVSFDRSMPGWVLNVVATHPDETQPIENLGAASTRHFFPYRDSRLPAQACLSCRRLPWVVAANNPKQRGVEGSARA